MSKSFIDLFEQAFINVLPDIKKVAAREDKSIIDYVFDVVKKNVDHYPLYKE